MICCYTLGVDKTDLGIMWRCRMFTVINMDEKINVELREGFKKLPCSSVFSDTNLEQKRQELIDQFTNLEVVNAHRDRISIEEKYVSGMNNNPKVKIRIYKPIKNQGKMPGLMYIHGGGYITGNAEMMDAECVELAEHLSCFVISPDYRLAPEYPYPAAVEDCYAALLWMWNQADMLAVDRDRIALLGESAGGGLVAAVAIMARDRKEVKVCFQVPMCPMIDERCITPSSNEMIDQRCWNRDANLFGWNAYLKDIDRECVPSYASPSHADTLEGLPPTYIAVGDLDPFVDENIEYVARLRKAHVPVEFHIYPGCFHGYTIIESEISKRYTEGYKEALYRAFYL